MMIEHDTTTTRNTTSTVRSSDGTTISYLSVGSGPAVIVVPGALSLASDYTAFARALWPSISPFTPSSGAGAAKAGHRAMITAL